MTRLLTIVFFLAACTGPTETREPAAVKAGQNCMQLCGDVRAATSQTPSAPPRKTGDACLCFEPLEAIEATRPAISWRPAAPKTQPPVKKDGGHR